MPKDDINLLKTLQIENNLQIFYYIWSHVVKKHIFAITNNSHMSKDNKNIKKDRFKNVASKRVQRVLDSLDSLCKCANKNNYEFEEEEVNKMIKTIRDKVKFLELSFNTNTKLNKETFTF